LYDENQFVRSGFRAVSNLMAKEYGINKQTLNHLLLNIFLKEGRERVFDKALKDLTIYRKEIVMEMVETYRSHFPNIRLYSDALEVLCETSRRYLTALITDGNREVQENKVRALGIRDHFKVITYAIEFGGKNNSGSFLATLERLNVEPSESMYIDDDPLKALATAKRLGIHTVRILKGENRGIKIIDRQCRPEFEISNLRQLFEVISP
jgi:putative hydrolase of the HAD superfamily